MSQTGRSYLATFSGGLYSDIGLESGCPDRDFVVFLSHRGSVL
jgi:hypothetical protein